MEIVESSVISMVDTLISNAITRKASDIHLEMQKDQLRIRYRIDGILYDQPALSVNVSQQIIARIKILANNDVAQKRIPQDGNFQIKTNDAAIDLRVSTFPAIAGEKIVIRILDKAHRFRSLEALGLSIPLQEKIITLMQKQHGFFLVAGPTGSGKTTTLYAVLAQLNKQERHVITLEDPVEYTIDRITQGQIHPEIGFSFACGIRAMLRQDPDVVMIGEMRDRETAHAAIEASLTGHLVLSTIHASDAPSSLTRLMDMAIEPFLINAAITGICAQRLARMLCRFCIVERKPTVEEHVILQRLNVATDSIFDSKGCDRCFNLGYSGRIGIFELLIISHELRSLLVKQPNFDVMYRQAMNDGMIPLLEDAKQKVMQGIISLKELVRVLL